MARRSRSSSFQLNAPTQVIFLISLVIAAVAVLSVLVRIPNVSPHAVWIAIIAYIVLALGCVLKGM
jgi:hypothetical protein